MLTMLALTLSVGIVIDDAIVVLENIYRFIEEKGMDPFEAAVEATKEIGLAVLATTLSLVAIFVPVGFMGGIVGRFMKSFGLTMAFAIMVSLLVSFTLTPMLVARAGSRSSADGEDQHSSKDSTDLPRRSTCSTRGCSNGRWRTARIVAGVAVLVLALERAALHHREQELHAAGRPVGVRDQRARAGRHEPRNRPRSSPTASPARSDSACRKSTTRWSTVARRSGEDAKPRRASTFA